MSTITRESFNSLTADDRDSYEVGSVVGVGRTFLVYRVQDGDRAAYVTITMPSGTPDSGATCAEVQDAATVYAEGDETDAFRLAMVAAVDAAVEDVRTA